MRKTVNRISGIILCAAVACSVSGNATAQDRDFKTALEECFWGLVLPDEDQRQLSLGLNVVSGALGTYAYSSATLSPDTFCAEKKAATASFINETYQKFVEDVARGEGEYLLTALDLAGCTAADDQMAVTEQLRVDLGAELSQPGYDSLSHAVRASAMFKSLHIGAADHCTV